MKTIASMKKYKKKKQLHRNKVVSIQKDKILFATACIVKRKGKHFPQKQ